MAHPEASSRDERRLEQLLDVTGDLAAAVTREEIATITIERGIRAVGASAGGLWLLEPATGELLMLGVSPLPRGSAARYHTVAADSDTPLATAVRTGEAVFLESLAEYEARFPASFKRIADLIPSDEVAYAMLPLAAKGAPIGAISFTYDRCRGFDHDDRMFKTILARQCAQALERVRLHAAETAARAAAEEATRAREEILSVVSHDLRNPLGAILIGASSLLAVDTGEKAQRIRTTAERIHRQAERMSRMIDDLVDFAGIQAGKLALERGPRRPVEIIAAARDMFWSLAEERELRLETRIPTNLPVIECDSDRAVQVIGNLVANALKVTPRGGAIAIGAESRDREVVFYVRDTGPGIEPDELPNLFERYWRSKKTSYKGAGLGLSIARGIVDAHGGRIWAESQVGTGSTFYFSLTARPSN